MTLPQWEMILRLAIAAALGSLVGLERERLGWVAGLRTHMLVSVGACLMMIVSAYGFSSTLGPHVVLDPSRVAAQVVSGIGFLGAGSIIMRNESIKGLTTAASVWAVAGLGLATGGGLYAAAVAATVIILVILAGLKPIEDRLQRSHGVLRLAVTSRRATISSGLLIEILHLRPAQIRQLVIDRDADGREEASLVLAAISAKKAKEIIESLRSLPELEDVRIIPAR